MRSPSATSTFLRSAIAVGVLFSLLVIFPQSARGSSKTSGWEQKLVAASISPFNTRSEGLWVVDDGMNVGRSVVVIRQLKIEDAPFYKGMEGPDYDLWTWHNSDELRRGMPMWDWVECTTEADGSVVTSVEVWLNSRVVSKAALDNALTPQIPNFIFLIFPFILSILSFQVILPSTFYRFSFLDIVLPLTPIELLKIPLPGLLHVAGFGTGVGVVPRPAA